MNKLELIGDFIAESTGLYLWPIMNIAPAIIEPNFSIVLIFLSIILLFIFQKDHKTTNFRTDINFFALKKNWQLRLYISGLIISVYGMVVATYSESDKLSRNSFAYWYFIDEAVQPIVFALPVINFFFILWLFIITYEWWDKKDTLNQHHKMGDFQLRYIPIDPYYVLYMIGFYFFTLNFIFNLSISKVFFRNTKMDFILYLVEIGICYLAYLFIKYIRNSIKQD